MLFFAKFDDSAATSRSLMREFADSRFIRSVRILVIWKLNLEMSLLTSARRVVTVANAELIAVIALVASEVVPIEVELKLSEIAFVEKVSDAPDALIATVMELAVKRLVPLNEALDEIESIWVFSVWNSTL